MKNKIINVIRPIDNGAEKEYLKEFFRFIGCFLSDCTIDEACGLGWEQYLLPAGEDGGVDIFINYFGNDPFQMECQIRNIKRIYCYFSFEKMYGTVSESPLPQEEALYNFYPSKAQLRKSLLKDLIFAIWRDEPAALQSVTRIADLYIDNTQGDLFFHLQMRRSLRFLSMGEVLKDPNATVSKVSLSPYLKQTLEGLWALWVQLDGYADAYSRYTRIKAASIMCQIIRSLRDTDSLERDEISYNGIPFRFIQTEELIRNLRTMIDEYPQFLSAFLCMAGLCRNAANDNRNEENCYLQILQSIPGGRREYAFIWYRIGYFFEKKYHNQEKALEYYQKALAADPEYYQALFKLGYYAAADGRFNEAESLLNRTILSIFHGRSTDPDEHGMYGNWLALSMKESQYAFKVYMLLSKIAINSNREYSVKSFIGKACMAATRFEEAGLVRHASTPHEFTPFSLYHRTSEPVWSIWQILKPWTEDIVRDDYVRNIVRQRLSQWQHF